MAARVYHPFDAEFAARCLDAAEQSYQFLQAHPADHRPNQSAFATGGYDAPDSDDRLWAAAELWETTGKPEYLRDFEARIQNRDASQRRRARRSTPIGTGATSATSEYSHT